MHKVINHFWKKRFEAPTVDLQTLKTGKCSKCGAKVFFERIPFDPDHGFDLVDICGHRYAYPGIYLEVLNR